MHRPACLLVCALADGLSAEEVAGARLHHLGLAAEVARDGAAAAKRAASEAHDLILMDVLMPVMDGLAATRAIRAAGRNAATPIVALTANAFRDDREPCLAARMNDHLVKPLDPAALHATLTRWLKAGTAAMPAAPRAPLGGLRAWRASTRRRGCAPPKAGRGCTGARWRPSSAATTPGRYGPRRAQPEGRRGDHGCDGPRAGCGRAGGPVLAATEGAALRQGSSPRAPRRRSRAGGRVARGAWPRLTREVIPRGNETR